MSAVHCPRPLTATSWRGDLLVRSSGSWSSFSSPSRRGRRGPQVRDLRARQANPAQVLRIGGQQLAGGGRHGRRTAPPAARRSSRGLRRQLLADDRAQERAVGIRRAPAAAALPVIGRRCGRSNPPSRGRRRGARGVGALLGHRRGASPRWAGRHPRLAGTAKPARARLRVLGRAAWRASPKSHSRAIRCQLASPRAGRARPARAPPCAARAWRGAASSRAASAPSGASADRPKSISTGPRARGRSSARGPRCTSA